MIMTSEQFGNLALHLLKASALSGGDLDMAIQFRDVASAMAKGDLVFSHRQQPVEVGDE